MTFPVVFVVCLMLMDELVSELKHLLGSHFCEVLTRCNFKNPGCVMCSGQRFELSTKRSGFKPLPGQTFF